MSTTPLSLESLDAPRTHLRRLRRRGDLISVPSESAPISAEHRETDRRHFRIFAISTAVLFVVYEAWMVFQFGGANVTGSLDDIGELVAALVSAATCAYVVKRRGRGLRQPFRLLGIASVAWAIGQAIWSFENIVRQIDLPFPSAADAFFLIAALFVLGGVASFGRSEIGRILRLRLILDGVLVAASILAILWSAVLDTAIHGHGDSLAEAIGLAYPLFDVATVSVAISLLVQRVRRDRVRLALIVAGLFGFILSDGAFAYSSEIHTVAHSSVLDSGWVLGFLFIGLAALRRARADDASPLRAHPWWQLGLPYLLLLGAVGASVGQSIAIGRVDDFLAVDGIVAVLAVLSRQVVILVENTRLATRLQGAVTALRNEEAELEHLAKHDPLTGLANRLLFAERLDATLREPGDVRLVAVIFCDLDSFKVVNDSLGHSAGDSVLVEVAARLSRCVRPADTVARIGGDEFAVVLDDLITPDDATSAASRIVEAMRQPILVDDEEFTIGASVGVAIRSTPELDLQTLLRDADVALYAAKDAGGNGYRNYAPELGVGYRERLRTQAELALASARDELFLEFQPIFDLMSGEILGAEALVRWQHPTRGRIEPLTFLDLAERSGAIVSIGGWVLRAALQQLADWRRSAAVGESFFIAVNLSARQLQGGGLVESVERALADSGIEASSLRLELTESALFDGADETIDLLTALKGLGLQLEIDDFGTGYASLSYLKRLPVDGVKVDQTFVAGLSDDAYDREIVATVVHLAHALGMEVVAEGVETPDQLLRLRALGCDCGQGFLLSPPRPALELIALFEAAPLQQ